MHSLENLIGWGQSALKYISNCTGTSTWKLGERNFALHCTTIKKKLNYNTKFQKHSSLIRTIKKNCSVYTHKHKLKSTWDTFGYWHCHRKLLFSTWLKPLQRGWEADIQQRNKTWTLNYTSVSNAHSCPLSKGGTPLHALPSFLRVLFQSTPEKKFVKKQKFTTSTIFKGTGGLSRSQEGFFFFFPSDIMLKWFFSSNPHWG